MQQDIARASDEAAAEYEDTTAEEVKTAEGIWKAMTTAAEKMVKDIKLKDFGKFLTVANPRNGDEFFEEVISSLYIMEFKCI